MDGLGYCPTFGWFFTNLARIALFLFHSKENICKNYVVWNGILSVNGLSSFPFIRYCSNYAFAWKMIIKYSILSHSWAQYHDWVKKHLSVSSISRWGTLALVAMWHRVVAFYANKKGAPHGITKWGFPAYFYYFCFVVQ